MNLYQITKITLALFSACVVAMTLKSSAQAHVPFIANDDHSTMQPALIIENISTSKVIYQKITSSAFESWIQFEGREGDILYIQLGIPDGVIKMVKDYYVDNIPKEKRSFSPFMKIDWLDDNYDIASFFITLVIDRQYYNFTIVILG